MLPWLKWATVIVFVFLNGRRINFILNADENLKNILPIILGPYIYTVAYTDPISVLKKLKKELLNYLFKLILKF